MWRAVTCDSFNHMRKDVFGHAGLQDKSAWALPKASRHIHRTLLDPGKRAGFPGESVRRRVHTQRIQEALCMERGYGWIRKNWS